MPADPTPRVRVEAERTRRGTAALAKTCATLLQGDYSDTRLITVLGGRTSPWALDRDRHDWYRVWAARGLLWCWHDRALPTILAALTDDAWRVREISAKVVARHLPGDALPTLTPSATTPLPRVRTAATQATTRLTQACA